MKPINKLVGGLLLVSLLFNVYMLSEGNQKVATKKVDQEFKVSIRRIASALISENGDYGSYLLAMEHSSRANSLSRFTSYAKRNGNVGGYTAEFINAFRNLILNKKQVKETDEIIDLLSKLAANPESIETAGNILILLNEESIP
ncbi:hypothetical protein [Brevibacillus sp. NRS-1366]|uniref:hypothetical protein n=1 Tax=Brevibacillus sp. NRS-1366 TaxID=3233899 RepID=UPI003D1F21C7